MPYRGGGCRTCKNRRVKCDQIKPTCQRCQKSKRACIWSTAGQDDFLIHIENDFVTGSTKRPRGPRSALTKRTNVPTEAVSRTLTYDLRTRAIGYYLHYQIKPLSQAPEDAESITQNLLDIVSAWLLGPNYEAVDHAVAPLALAVFSQTHRHQPAAAIASANYLQLLQDTLKTVGSLTKTDIEACLISVFLMGRYEDAVFDPSDGVGRPFLTTIQSHLHNKGVLAILKVWKENFSSDQPASDIIKQSRRGTIWIAILQSRLLPKWLHDGSAFGEVGLDLEYDQILVQLAGVRHHFSLLRNIPAVETNISQTLLNAEALCRRTRQIDEALEHHKARYPAHWSCWSANVTGQQIYPTQYIFTPLVHIYTSYNYALCWNRYFSLRMLINRTRFDISQYCGTTADSRIADIQLECVSRIKEMASRLAASMPYCMQRIRIINNPDSPSSGDLVVPNNDDEINPYLASMASWPLAIAASIKDADFDERPWFKSLLAVIGRVTGVAFFQYAESERWLQL